MSTIIAKIDSAYKAGVETEKQRCIQTINDFFNGLDSMHVNKEELIKFIKERR